MYDWKDFYTSTVPLDAFLKAVLKLLKEGGSFTNTDGVVVGHAKFIDGPMGHIIITSDFAFGDIILINITYLESLVCSITLTSKSATTIIHKNGHWSNTICRYKGN